MDRAELIRVVLKELSHVDESFDEPLVNFRLDTVDWQKIAEVAVDTVLRNLVPRR